MEIRRRAPNAGNIAAHLHPVLWQQVQFRAVLLLAARS